MRVVVGMMTVYYLGVCVVVCQGTRDEVICVEVREPGGEDWLRAAAAPLDRRGAI